MDKKFHDFFRGQKIACLGIGQTFFDAMKHFPVEFDWYIDSDKKKKPVFFGNSKLRIIETKVFFSSKKNLDNISVIVFTPNFVGIKNFLSNHGFTDGVNLFYFLDFAEFQPVFPKICREKEYYFLEKILRSDDCCIDAGANVGLYTYKMSSLTNSKKKNIFAFEPIKENFEQLLRHIRLFDLSNVEALNSALDNENGKILEMVMPIKDGVPLTGHSYLTKNLSPSDNLFTGIEKDSLGYNFYRVNATTIDNFVERRKIESVQFIKIDVEGSEMNVLNGATSTLNKFKPIVQIELVNGSNKFKQILNCFARIGFSMFRVSNKFKLVKSDITDQKGEKNFFFIHISKINEILRLQAAGV